MSWWDAAYRSGHVNWDPGAYDGHIDWLFDAFRLEPCRAIDLGCGTGKSAVYLAERGFAVVGVDRAPTAIEQARSLARRRGVAEAPRGRLGRAPGSARFVQGLYPEDFPLVEGQESSDRELERGSFGFVMDRGFLQHVGPGKAFERTIAHARKLMTPDGLLYTLIAAREGNRGQFGPRLWTKDEISRSFEPLFDFEALELSVFTPGERGSMNAWAAILKPSF
jgi:SAM-dependent methyltransferase